MWLVPGYLRIYAAVRIYKFLHGVVRRLGIVHAPRLCDECGKVLERREDERRHLDEERDECAVRSVMES